MPLFTKLVPPAIVALLSISLCSCGTSRTVLAAASLQSQFAAGGNISLPAGTIEIGCGAQLTITKTAKVVGAGRNQTILKDTCATGDTLTVDLTSPITVTIEDMQISHVTSSGTALRAKGGIAQPVITSAA